LAERLKKAESHLDESFFLAERLKVIWLKVKAGQAVFTPARL
jgi:hypothetical protein